MTTGNNKKQTSGLTPEDYNKAMNFIGQSQLANLVKTMQELPESLRSNEMVLQGLAAFLSNVLHKQFPTDAEARGQIFERFSKLVNTHLDNIKEPA